MPDFDPFNDRLARDIRNLLSETMVANLPTFDLEPVRQCATTFATRQHSAAHQKYIEDRLHRYQQVVAALHEKNEADPFRQALALWNAKLFFEVHEIMENLWKKSTGGQKTAYQAMFRAAGTYIHLEQGNHKAARSMADKAISGLLDHGDHLPLPIDITALTNALKQLDPDPPRLTSD
ncbi:MAG: DUF309 domain-containing protein [Desulfobulbaceae bacterium]|nr:DUF309 domain-containing protein [Desulfobulbaceae bacterium]